MAFWEGASLMYEITKEKGATAVCVCSNKLYIAMTDPLQMQMQIIEVDTTDGATKLVTGPNHSNQVIDCLMAASPWVIAASITGIVVYIAADPAKHITITQQGGQVHTMLAIGDELFLGAQNGTIFRWKLNDRPNATDLPPLNGHSSGVLTLCQLRDRQLLSGSADKTIRLWDLDRNVCMCVLRGHSDSVNSVILWDPRILSCSDDGTIKMWHRDTGALLSTTLEDNHGFVALCRIPNRANMPILLSSSRDNSVRIYNFPSLTEIGRIFSLAVVKSIFQMADCFITRDSSGHVAYWKLADSEGSDNQNMRADVPNTSVGFQLLMHDKCHDTDVKGIAYLQKYRNSKYYTCCKDVYVELDPCTGQRQATPGNGNIGSMLLVEETLFIGFPDLVEAVFTHEARTIMLQAPGSGQVHSLAFINGYLFAGTEVGMIMAWGFIENAHGVLVAHVVLDSNLAPGLAHHGGAVHCLIATEYESRERVLYSGSADTLIKGWVLTATGLMCYHTINFHTAPVTSLINWAGCLFSSSLDGSLAAFNLPDSTSQQHPTTLRYSFHHATPGKSFIQLCGMYDADGKSLLLCSTDDNFIYLCEITGNGLTLRRKLSTYWQVKKISTAAHGVFLMGDETGLVTVWTYGRPFPIKEVDGSTLIW